MKIKKSKTIVRSFTTKAPDWIQPIYDCVQHELNSVLSNSAYTSQLINLQLKTRDKNGKLHTIARGKLWKAVQDIIDNPLSGKINNSAWYNRILISNLIALVASRQYQVNIYKILQANNFKINQTLRIALAKKHLYPTNTELNNLIRVKQMPALPKHAVLKLNYAISDKQMFKFNNDLSYEVKVLSSKQAKEMAMPAWNKYQLYLPSYIHADQLVKICKPNFVYSQKFHKIVCVIAYEIKPHKHPDFKNVLGVDIGKVKLYSATALHENGHYSEEYVPSRQLAMLNHKLFNLNKHINRVYDKKKRVYKYNNDLETPKMKRRYQDYQNSREKRTRLKEHIEWVIANELIAIALHEKCKEIHLENLTWINNQGGKWDFSYLMKHIQYAAELEGIAIVLINPKNTSKRHPVTKEIGYEAQRDIVFKDQRIDRDQLAGLNIALVNNKTKVSELHRRNAAYVKRMPNRRRNLINKQRLDLIHKQSMQIVMFLREQATDTFLTLALINRKLCKLTVNNLLSRKEFAISKFTV